MSGRVRLLLFWVGRENVGLGKISVEQSVDADLPRQTEKITVLFGTVPDRVPGKINRWGYGEEVAYWNLAGSDSEAKLDSSTFTGFMRHSPEESISQVVTSSRAQDQKQFWYDGIASLVRPDEAQTDIFNFPLIEEVTSERMDSVIRAFDIRRASGAADKSRALHNQPLQYESPQGFLLCLKRMMSGIIREFKISARAGSWMPSLNHSTYVYNSKLYGLRTTKVKLHKAFQLENPNAAKSSSLLTGAFRNVAETGFDIIDVGSNERHSFFCWFPLEGALEGIPIQIQDNPRWWLQVRLQLKDIEETQTNH
jgi:hypothetical protein